MKKKTESDYICILVVDDEPVICNLLKQAINNIGYLCYAAPNAKKALKILEKNHIDVLITDIVLPGKSGLELTSMVREQFDCDVMVMTGFERGMKYEQVIGLGAKDFIRKPVSPEEIIVRLNRILTERKLLVLQKQTENELKKYIARLKNLLENTVNALASAFEKRDPYTAGHQKRVAKIACGIAARMQLSENHIQGIRIAALLHDIGKISIPVDILSKPGKLNDIEFALIKQHSQTGYEIIKEIDFNYPIALTVLQHHERLNGKGYPFGLKSDDIIQPAKIIAVADVVEAMTSDRPYRPGLGIDKAIAEINDNKGVLYDPDSVEHCIATFKSRDIFKDT